MSHHKLSLLLISVLLFLNESTAIAIPVRSLNLPTLTRNADLIVVGQIVGVHEVGRTNINVNEQTVPARLMSVTVRVDRTIKGSLPRSAVSFTYLIPSTPVGFGSIAPTQYGMFFLRRESVRSYAVLDPYYPFVTAIPDGSVVKGSDLERVAAEVINVLASPSVSPDLRREALSVLESVVTEKVTAALHRTARESDTVLSLEAIGMLLRRNDISMLDKATEVLLQPPPNVDDYILKNLAYAIGYGVRDPESIPALTRLLSAPDMHVRRNAVSALRHAHVEAAIGPLSIALDDSDHDVRYEAVMGLAEITGQDRWAPSIQLFARDEERFLTYWREWARAKK